jgi:hypothetical protein
VAGFARTKEVNPLAPPTPLLQPSAERYNAY